MYNGSVMATKKFILFTALLGTLFVFPPLTSAEECPAPQSCSAKCAGLPSGYISGGNPDNFKYEDCLTSCNATWPALEEEHQMCLQRQAIPPPPPPPAPEPPVSPEPSPPPPPPPETQKTKRTVSFESLKPGETVLAGKDERVTISFSDGSRVELDSGSSFQVVSPDEVKNFKGRAHWLFEKLIKDRRFRVRSSNAVTSVRGTEFTVEVKKSKTIVSVMKGIVEVTSKKKKKTVKVKAGQKITVTNKGFSKRTELTDADFDYWWLGD